MVDLGYGLRATTWRAEDEAVVVQIDGAPPDDEHCNRVRVYLNDGYASQWLAPGEQGYGGS